MSNSKVDTMTAGTTIKPNKVSTVGLLIASRAVARNQTMMVMQLKTSIN